MKKILVIAHKHSKHYGLFDDLQGEDRAILRYSILRPINNRLIKFIRRVHHSQKINRIKYLPFKYFWYDFHDVLSLATEIKCIVVIDLALENPVLLDILEKSRNKNPDIKIFLYYLNSIGSDGKQKRGDLRNAIDNAQKFKFDDIYSFDIDDANKFGMRYLGFNYYSWHSIKINPKPQYDLYYIGRSTLDRNDLFYNVYKALISNDCNFDFYIKPRNAEEPRLPGVKYIESEVRSYHDILNDLQNSKCILEILREKQKGPSLRYFEAVCYNKKLLTTNPEIVNFPYYDNRFMKIFSNPDDIDIEWLKDTSCDVDYHYKGDFSPVTLVNQLLEESDKQKQFDRSSQKGRCF